MALNLALIFIIPISFSLPSFLTQALPNQASNGIDRWCSKTPHPEPCKISLGRPRRHAPRGEADFRTMMVEAALERALHAEIHVNELRRRCSSKRKLAAWLDCSGLISNTVFQLNNTLQGLKATAANVNWTDADCQTWLSTALTNLDTCRAGSHQLNVSNFISPVVSNNVSELISNGLAINGALLDGQETEGEFPSWVSAGERKLLESPPLSSQANFIVAQDGSGHFRSIQAAINLAVSRRRRDERITIHVKRGVYREYIQINKNMNKITLVGDGMRHTIISGKRSVASGYTIYSCATVGIDGAGFMARGITFRNRAGPQNGQAVAVRSASDFSVFYACGFEGYQDTLFVLAQRQFFKMCYIYGTIDFIFGNAAVVFQNCIIYVRKPLWGQANVIAAQGRIDPYQNTGISIQGSRVVATPGFARVVRSYNTYLGRPWQRYSRTVFLQSYLGSLVNPAGWLAWENTDFAQDTLYFGEYKNFGPASSTTRRVNWKGHHVITSAGTASQFTVANLIAGNTWLPATGVPFTAGL
ncbi:probable pectinesterase/pectinesterase inhibitor 59 [Rhododendron vialii]|uniref:probable pectinesterase/pectinesterase inhibitor 59 n=1 Tax=Rhododendron vialii TaxID=182163 RepID=UPI00265EEAA2|nr:probable pectinesterase/pectinesterase inhibitor 59 [Rhododendron vialii]